MGLDRYLGQIGAIMAPALGDELAYHHAADGTDTTVVGFLKWKDSEQDPIAAPTKRQKIPVIRVQGLPWADDELKDDTVDCDGWRWRVTGGLARPSGWTDLYVADKRPAA